MLGTLQPRARDSLNRVVTRILCLTGLDYSVPIGWLAMVTTACTILCFKANDGHQRDSRHDLALLTKRKMLTKFQWQQATLLRAHIEAHFLPTNRSYISETPHTSSSTCIYALYWPLPLTSITLERSINQPLPLLLREVV